MSDLLRRRFRDKLQSRPHVMPKHSEETVTDNRTVPSDSLRVICHRFFGEMLTSSTSARVHVESMDPKTGEYKVIVLGTLDTEQTPFELE